MTEAGDFRPLAGSKLFLGNLYRFNALTAFKMFKHVYHLDESAFKDNFHLLIEALESAQLALE